MSKNAKPFVNLSWAVSETNQEYKLQQQQKTDHKSLDDAVPGKKWLSDRQLVQLPINRFTLASDKDGVNFFLRIPPVMRGGGLTPKSVSLFLPKKICKRSPIL